MGDWNPPKLNGERTVYGTLFVSVLPALSVAEHCTEKSPAALVTTGPQDEDASPDSASLALGDADTTALRSTVAGTTGLSVGFVASRFTLTVHVPVPPSLVIEQVSACPSTSLEMVTGSHPDFA